MTGVKCTVVQTLISGHPWVIPFSSTGGHPWVIPLSSTGGTWEVLKDVKTLGCFIPGTQNFPCQLSEYFRHSGALLGRELAV